MQRYNWKPEYETGYDPLDRQHAQFLAVLNRIVDHADAGAEILGSLLVELYYFAQYHFRSEENMMAISGYTGTPDQVVEHSALLHDFRARIDRFRNGETSLDGMMEFCAEWFVQHTIDEDHALGRYLRSLEGRP